MTTAADERASAPDRRALGVALAAGGMLGVSFDSPLVRYADVDGWTASFWYGVFATPVLLAVAWFETNGDPVGAARRSGRTAVVSAVFMAVSGIAFVVAVTLTAISNVVVIVATTPIAAALASLVLLGERTDRATWIAIAGTAAGVLVVVGGSLGSGGIGGDLLALVAVSAFAVNITLLRRHPEIERSIVVAGAAVLTAAICVVPATPFGHDTSTYVALAVMGGITGAAGRLALSAAPRHLPAAQVSLFAPVETVAATLWGWWFFDEFPTAPTWIGGAMILAFVGWGTSRMLRTTPPADSSVAG